MEREKGLKAANIDDTNKIIIITVEIDKNFKTL